MNQQTFESSYAVRWDEFAHWLERTAARRKDAEAAGLASFDMPARYRELCQHLALARDRQYSADLIERLSRLALGGHQVLYGAHGHGLDRVRNFLRAGFPRAVRREWRFVWLAIALFYLIFNGVYIGAFTGYIVDAGLAERFFSFTAGHSSFELLAICLSGAAGLKLGYSLIAPGRLTRTAALRVAAEEAIPLMIGVAGMLFIAAAIEAFWSPRTFLAPIIKYAIGVSLWVVHAVYFLLAGRGHGS